MKYFIIPIFAGFLLSSCINGDEKKHIITKFDQSICDTIKPNKDISYTTKCIKVKGFVDDSVFVSFGDKDNGYFLSKQIDTVFNPDYYGGHEVIFLFKPYKAKKGNVEITFSLLGSSK